jgi:glucosamine--fructose-6-phosphate aminotransferase (isomerizing)
VHFADGIAAQPAALAQSRTAVVDALPALPVPPAGAVVALVGIGASEHAARGAAVAWRALGLRAFAVPAAELTTAGAADLYVAISESGRSTETLAAVDAVGGERALAVVNDADSPLARACRDVLVLGSGADSPIYTTGYVATLQALGILGEHWSGSAGNWSALPDLAGRVLDEAPARVDRVRDAFDAARVVDVVASGVGSATAGEGALLLRESARLLTAAHETRDYLHGPMEPLGPGVACLVAGEGREIRLADDVASLGCATLLVTAGEAPPPREGLAVLPVPRAGSPLAGAVLQMLPLQLLAWSVAQRRGLRVDGFRHRQDDTKQLADGPGAR